MTMATHPPTCPTVSALGTWTPGDPLHVRPHQTGDQVVRPIFQVLSAVPDEMFGMCQTTFWCSRCQVGGANSLCWNCGGDLP